MSDETTAAEGFGDRDERSGERTGDDWERIWSIFEEAVELPRDEIPAHLDRACGDDTSLRRAVEELLRADRTEGDAFFDRPPIEGLLESGSHPSPSSSAASSAGSRGGDLDQTQVGPYSLRSKIGEGGMGAVYLATRDDDEFRRRVVVKIIRPGMETEQIARRFRAERQILASLEHPNIARLYDGGSTAQGAPFVVMEHVDGVPIDVYCSSHELSVGDVLRLFRKVCAAVSYAHRNLVVHRDLKPSNILVTAGGEPKLLDFGIAKLLNPEIGTADLAPTVTAARMLTPSYASPEQIRGRMVTTSSDVYSLGVLLYELLTGRLPFDFSRRSPSEIERLITATDPPRPSVVAQTTSGAGAGLGERERERERSRLRKRLAGDLDAIVLKALRSAPPKRYASVDAFSDDIGRHLRGEPVAARRGGVRYRLGKLIARYRAALAVAAVILGLLLWFGASSARQAARLEIERDRARLERDAKQQVIGLFEDIVSFAEPYAAPGEDLTMRRALLDSLPVLESRLDDQPRVRAQLLHTSGSMLDRLGAHDDARRQLDEALALRRAEHGDDSAEVAETAVALASALTQLGEYDRALELARSSVAFYEDAEGRGATHAVRRVGAINQLVSTLCALDQFDVAEQPAREALRWARRLEGEDRVEGMVSLDLLSTVQLKRGHYGESAARRRESLALRRELYGEKHPSLMLPLSNLGVALRQAGELEAAERAYAESLELIARVYGETDYRYAFTLNNLAAVQTERGDYTSAVESYRRAGEIFRESAGPEHWRNLFFALNVEASRLELGEPEPVERAVRSALGVWEPRLGDDHWLVASARSLLGAAVAAQDRHDEAEPLLRDGYLGLVEAGASHRARKVGLERLAAFLDARGRAGEIARYQAMLEPDDESS